MPEPKRPPVIRLIVSDPYYGFWKDDDDRILFTGYRLGNRGDFIKQYQVLLNQFGAKLDTNGTFDSQTEEAVRSFQGSHGLNTNEIIDSQMDVMLKSSKFEADPNVADFFNNIMNLVKTNSPFGGYWEEDLVRVVGSLVGGYPIQLPEFVDNILVEAMDYMPISFILKTCLENIPSNDEESYRLKKRIEALYDFINYLIALANPFTHVSLNKDRVKIVLTALSQIGRVSALKKGSVEYERQMRYGWRLLDEYQATSYGCRCQTPSCKGTKNSEGKDCNYTRPLQENARYYSPTLLQSWCGHFDLWAIKTSLGATSGIGDWKQGGGISSVKGIKQVLGTPKPGDIGYKESLQHHCIVVKVIDSQITTVDGNSDNSEIQCYSGVWLHPNQNINQFSAFYRVEMLD